MRRKNQEITDRSEIDALIRRAMICRIAVSDDDRPYIVPVCFGYDGSAIYVHGAHQGMKSDVLKKNPRVCFEVDVDCTIEKADKPCDWGISYKSVIGFGTAGFVEEAAAKHTALDHIMKQYSDKPFTYDDKMVGATQVIKITIESITGKHSN